MFISFLSSFLLSFRNSFAPFTNKEDHKLNGVRRKKKMGSDTLNPRYINPRYTTITLTKLTKINNNPTKTPIPHTCSSIRLSQQVLSTKEIMFLLFRAAEIWDLSIQGTYKKVKLVTTVEGDLKASFSIATTLSCKFFGSRPAKMNWDLKHHEMCRTLAVLLV